jgi:hypothetical protein
MGAMKRYNPAQLAVLKTFAHEGAARVVFACGTASCFSGASQAAAALERAGARADVEYAKGAGHRSYGPIVDAMATKVAWLVDGDPRFARKGGPVALARLLEGEVALGCPTFPRLSYVPTDGA